MAHRHKTYSFDILRTIVLLYKNNIKDGNIRGSNQFKFVFYLI
jgi:hypothetical protein